MFISEILMHNTIRTKKSGVLLEKIDRVEFDAWVHSSPAIKARQS